MQFDADTVGAASMAADAEICMMAADTMEALGIPRGQYVVKVNNRKVLDGVMECDRTRRRRESRGKRLTVLRAIDKLDRLGVDGVRAAARPGTQRRESAISPRAPDSDDIQIQSCHQFYGAGASRAIWVRRARIGKRSDDCRTLRQLLRETLSAKRALLNSQ